MDTEAQGGSTAALEAHKLRARRSSSVFGKNYSQCILKNFKESFSVGNGKEEGRTNEGTIISNLILFDNFTCFSKLTFLEFLRQRNHCLTVTVLFQS